MDSRALEDATLQTAVLLLMDVRDGAFILDKAPQDADVFKKGGTLESSSCRVPLKQSMRKI